MPIPWLAAAAATHEWLHGPLPDVVKTQGKHLTSRPTTPTYIIEPDPHFLSKLDAELERLSFVQNQRERQYGEDIAKEWPINHTPPEVKARWHEDQAKFDDFLDNLPPTPSDDGSMQSSSFGGPTLVSQKPYPVPVVSLPKVTPTKETSFFRSSRSITTLRVTSQRRLSQLDNIRAPLNMSMIHNSVIIEEPVTIIKVSKKRRYSDVENNSPISEPRRSKRRIAVPRLHGLVAAG